MTPEQLKEMIDWFSAETKQLIKDIHKYKKEHDYYNAAKAENTRDVFIRCTQKLHELKEQMLP